MDTAQSGGGSAGLHDPGAGAGLLGVEQRTGEGGYEQEVLHRGNGTSKEQAKKRGAKQKFSELILIIKDL